jgi:hypothetical protein
MGSSTAVAYAKVLSHYGTIYAKREVSARIPMEGHSGGVF